MACSQNRVTLLADFDHDGYVDENRRTASESTVTVLPLPALPATSTCTDWTLMGGVDALDAGTVWINDSQPAPTEAPFGGYKDSGIGRQNGYAGFDQYVEIKSVAWPVDCT